MSDEVVILDEMLAAGEEQLEECRRMKMNDRDTCELIYMAMYGLYKTALRESRYGKPH